MSFLLVLLLLSSGGYYLTSVYASLHLIQNLEQGQRFSGRLTPQVQDALKEWSCRRSLEAQKQKDSQQSQVGTKLVGDLRSTRVFVVEEVIV